MRSEKQDAKVNSTESAPRGATDSAKTANEGRGSGSQAAFTQYVRNIQAKGGQPVAGPEAQEAAAKGVEGSGQPMPHIAQIQRSFGHHDLGGVTAHVGGPAAQANETLGARAFASGNDVAFKGQPDLHTAAHEAAHVVQQRAGVHLKDGVGRSGDAYEQHADAVASKVVSGGSAEGLLDQMAGPSRSQGLATDSKAIQKKQGEDGVKKVSANAGARLSKAKSAIEHAKQAFAFGAGNQAEALKGSKFNSYYRMKAMRDPGCWEMAASVRPIAAANPDALTAAKADLAHGGNCGEHAQVAFDYLRVAASGEVINRADKEGLDHAFVLIGDMAKDSDSAIVVSDPWPTKATACVWEDHFAFTADRAKVNIRSSMTADGSNVKAVIAAGLKLSSRGLQMIQMSMTEKETDEKVKDGMGGWVWQHEATTKGGHNFDYQTEGQAPRSP